jgi:hypothetical protein
VDLLLVSVGVTDRSDTPDELTRAGARSIKTTSASADATSVDNALDQRQDRRLVIDADLAGLNLVLSRLMRRGELDVAETAVLVREPVPFLTRVGLPSDRTGQLGLAVHGEATLVGVIKDDSGGLCVDSASMAPWQQGPWWVRAVVDDQRLCDGNARSLTVRRLGPSELEATVQLGRFRTKTCRGRSLQLACDEALIVADDLPRERPRSKRTFWSEPKLWKLALS